MPRAEEAAALLTVPLLIGSSIVEHTAFRQEPVHYPNVHEMTLYELERSAHCHNFASKRVHS
ncbi:MAG TPA: hypothetical protein VHZ51_20180 [Ktedonobacteraceae bacterium]|nr:hypothetical protein [Ktedonobacteraceae bacterium]